MITWSKPIVLTATALILSVSLTACSKEKNEQAEAIDETAQVEQIDWSTVQRATAREGGEAMYRVYRHLDHNHQGRVPSIELSFVAGEGVQDQLGRTYEVSAEQWKAIVLDMRSTMESQAKPLRPKALPASWYKDSLGEVTTYEYEVVTVSYDLIELKTLGEYRG
ncbi:MAG: hypothetical protein ACF8NJ_02995 [Phycisphaerales bacterium JB038]